MNEYSEFAKQVIWDEELRQSQLAALDNWNRMIQNSPSYPSSMLAQASPEAAMDHFLRMGGFKL